MIGSRFWRGAPGPREARPKDRHRLTGSKRTGDPSVRNCPYQGVPAFKHAYPDRLSDHREGIGTLDVDSLRLVIARQRFDFSCQGGCVLRFARPGRALERDRDGLLERLPSERADHVVAVVRLATLGAVDRPRDVIRAPSGRSVVPSIRTTNACTPAPSSTWPTISALVSFGGRFLSGPEDRSRDRRSPRDTPMKTDSTAKSAARRRASSRRQFASEKISCRPLCHRPRPRPGSFPAG